MGTVNKERECVCVCMWREGVLDWERKLSCLYNIWKLKLGFLKLVFEVSLVNTSLGHKYPPNLIEAHYPCTVCLWELCTTRALCPKNSFSISVIDKWNTILANIISASSITSLKLKHCYTLIVFLLLFYRHSLILILSTDSYFLSFSYIFISF